MTKILVISDIHRDDRGIEFALEQTNHNEVWCLGDVSGHIEYVKEKYNGYLGNHLKCYQLLKQRHAHCIKGNWEHWLLNQAKDNDPQAFQFKYREELIAERKVLEGSGILEWIDKEWKTEDVQDDFTLTHGSIDNNGDEKVEKWEYYLYPDYTREVGRLITRKKLETHHMLFGHTHIPGFFKSNGNVPEWYPLTPQNINDEFDYNLGDHLIHFIINPGSLNVNNGRRSDIRAGLPGTALIIDTETQKFRFLPITPGV